MKSMGKTSRGKGFRGVLNYVLDHDNGRVIGGNMSGDTARALSTEFAAVRQMRPEVKKPVWHQSLRLTEGEHISDEKWREIGDLYMKKMGFDADHPYALVKHDKAEGEHIHIVASRISLSGKLYAGKDENLLSTKITSEIEMALDLALTDSPKLDEKTGLPSTRTERHKVKKGEVESALRTGVKPARLVIQNAIDAALKSSPDLPTLTATLEKNGITVLPFVKDDEIKGLSFSTGAAKFSGSQLGDAYKYPQILKQLNKNKELNHDKARTDSTIAVTPRIALPGDIPRPSPASNQKNDARNQTVAAGIGSAKGPDFSSSAAQNQSFLTSSTSNRGAVMKFPATLGGKLYNQKSPDVSNAYDIFYTSDKQPAAPVMRWHSDTQRLDLLRQPPSEQDLQTLFELARNQGLKPPFELHGPADFQRAAMLFAVKNNITVAPQNKKVGLEHVQQSAANRTSADAAGAAASAAAATAAAADKKKYEIEQVERAKQLYEQQQEQRGNKKSSSLKLD